MIKNNRGFTLVQVLIVAGLLGGLSLVVMNLTKQTTKSSAKYQFDTEINLITNEINAILSDPDKCLATFRNGANNNLTPNNITSKYYTLASGSAPTQGYGNGGVDVNAYALSVSAHPSNDGILDISFKNKNILKGSGGQDLVHRRINMYIEQNASGLILRCRSLSTSSTDVWTRGSGSEIYYNGGKVGVGNNNPAAMLDVSGEAKLGSTGLACNANTEGSQRYNSTTKTMEFCNGTSWSSPGGATEISGSNPTCPAGKGPALKLWNSQTCGDPACSPCTTANIWSPVPPVCGYTWNCNSDNGTTQHGTCVAASWSGVKCL